MIKKITGEERREVKNIHTKSKEERKSEEVSGEIKDIVSAEQLEHNKDSKNIGNQRHNLESLKEESTQFLYNIKVENFKP